MAAMALDTADGSRESRITVTVRVVKTVGMTSRNQQAPETERVRVPVDMAMAIVKVVVGALAMAGTLLNPRKTRLTGQDSAIPTHARYRCRLWMDKRTRPGIVPTRTSILLFQP